MDLLEPEWLKFVTQGLQERDKKSFHDAFFNTESIPVLNKDLCMYWHGTKRENIPKIFCEGFKNGYRSDLLMGPGIYLSPDVAISIRYGSILPCGLIPIIGCSIKNDESVLYYRDDTEIVVDCTDVMFECIALVSRDNIENISAWSIKK